MAAPRGSVRLVIRGNAGVVCALTLLFHIILDASGIILGRPKSGNTTKKPWMTESFFDAEPQIWVRRQQLLHHVQAAKRNLIGDVAARLLQLRAEPTASRQIHLLFRKKADFGKNSASLRHEGIRARDEDIENDADGKSVHFGSKIRATSLQLWAAIVRLSWWSSVLRHANLGRGTSRISNHDGLRPINKTKPAIRGDENVLQRDVSVSDSIFM
mmetsp:Transcript_96638/g.152912  ORF Transcript_96638/g.152912 Transcript_96638/m.152912 type:complete len:214 (-) Transcript_96638:501-1142(-)